MKRNIFFALLIFTFSFQIALGQDVVVEVPEEPAQNNDVVDPVPADPVAQNSSDNFYDIPREYLLGPGDVIEGKVFGEKQFDFTAQIDELGRFEIPFTEQQINARCKTRQEIRELVKQQLAEYLVDPKVSLQIRNRRTPVPVVVYGEVNRQQRVTLTRQTTLMEILAFSNGVKESAGGKIIISRSQIPMCQEENSNVNWKEEPNNKSEIPSRIYSLKSLENGDPDSNPVIFPGDIILVDRAAPVYINGQVGRSNGLYIKEGGLSLSQALAMIGGARDKADLKHIKIYRLKPNSNKDRELISANLKAIRKGEAEDIMLQPYDVVDVETKKASIGEIILNTLIKTGTGVITRIGYQFPNRILY